MRILMWSSGRSLRTPVVVLSGYASLDNALRGADFAGEAPCGGEAGAKPARRHWIGRRARPGASMAADRGKRRPGVASSRALARDAGRQTEVAARTGLERTQLCRKIKMLGLRSSLKGK